MIGKLALVGLGLGSFLPVWSCGLRKRLTFWEFALDHTVFGPEPEYVPEELYTQPLTEEEFEELCALREAEQILAAGSETATGTCPHCRADIRLPIPLPQEVRCPGCSSLLELT